LVCCIGRNRIAAVILTLVLGAGLSLAIETIQACEPARNSSALDLVMNAAGARTGILVVTGFAPTQSSATASSSSI
jgi:VanZ family protein